MAKAVEGSPAGSWQGAAGTTSLGTTSIRGWAPSGENRVIRGGSFRDDAQRARAANRNRRNPEIENENLGFRVVLPAAPSPRP